MANSGVQAGVVMLATSTSPGRIRPKSVGPAEHPGRRGDPAGAGARCRTARSRSARARPPASCPPYPAPPSSRQQLRGSGPASAAAHGVLTARQPAARHRAAAGPRGRARIMHLRAAQPEHVLGLGDRAPPPTSRCPSSSSIRRICGQARPMSASASSPDRGDALCPAQQPGEHCPPRRVQPGRTSSGWPAHGGPPSRPPAECGSLPSSAEVEASACRAAASGSSAGTGFEKVQVVDRVAEAVRGVAGTGVRHCRHSPASTSRHGGVAVTVAPWQGTLSASPARRLGQPRDTTGPSGQVVQRPSRPGWAGCRSRAGKSAAGGSASCRTSLVVVASVKATSLVAAIGMMVWTAV